jgi:prolipoprotein diacylglyceryltransferase
MQIKKGGFVYELAYGWAEERRIPHKTGLCKLFWRCVLGVFIWIVMVLLVAVVFGLGFVIGFWVAQRPAITEKDVARKERRSDLNVPYVHWPTVNGVRILPICVLIAIVIGGAIIFLLPDLIRWMYHETVGFATFSVTHSGMIFWEVMLGLGILLWLFFRFPKTELGVLVIAWLKAKKEGVCPLVEIVE